MKTLLVILGPTGVGKTELSLRLAERLKSPIISADSRQIYREIPIGTAAPTPEEQAGIQHFFVGNKVLTDNYSAGQYERDVLTLLESLFRTHDTLILTGGSMMYIDAVCNGLDDIPPTKQEVRENLLDEYHQKGLVWLQQEVEKTDPVYWEIVDQQNPQRLLHCIEVYRSTGKTFSSMHKHVPRIRPFRIVKFGLYRPRAELYERINRRVDLMMEQGLEAEARNVYPLRELNSLRTVGYRELFGYIEGQYEKAYAVDMIKQNTRHYAKRQMTWFKRDKTIHWLNADLSYEEQIHTIFSDLH